MTGDEFRAIRSAQDQIVKLVIAYGRCAQGIDLSAEEDFDDLENAILEQLLTIPRESEQL